ncbi:MAG: efflux RND transporter periplasmic adaptor subunit [Myxococcota bacterium]
MSALARALVPLLIVAGALALYLGLVGTRPAAPRTPPRDDARLVEVITLQAGHQAVTVEARGQVIPAKRVALVPQVTGIVRWVSPRLVPGGHFDAGETLLRLDDREYRLSLQTQRASRSDATLALRLEREQQAVAEQEWALFERMASAGTVSRERSTGEALARRQPQLENAELAAQAAEANLDRARLDLTRTRLPAPFPAMVLEESVEVSQLVGPTSAVVTLVGTEAFWIEVAVPAEQLPALRIPPPGADEGEGSRARITHRVGEGSTTRPGRVLRLLPDLDPNGAMARVLVAVEDPLDLEREDADARVPLLLGSYVEVRIEAAPLTDVIEVPRAAVHEGSRAYVMNHEGELEIRSLAIVWRRRESVLVRGGLAAGERLVTSRVAHPVPGLPLRSATPSDADEPALRDDGTAGAPATAVSQQGAPSAADPG